MTEPKPTFEHEVEGMLTASEHGSSPAAAGSQRPTHSPTPWALCAHLRDHDECSCGYRGGIWDASGEIIICELGSSPDRDETGAIMGHTQPQADRPTQLADAAHIVRCVNAHDAIVMALREMLAWYGKPAREEWLNDAAWRDALAVAEKARAALSLAESKP